MSPRGLLRRLVLLAALLAAPHTSLADDYRPVICERPASYRGAPTHPPIMLDAAALTGALSAPLDAAAVARLNTAFDAAFLATRAQAMTVAVGVPGLGAWTRTSAGGAPRFYWASAGKQATAAIVLQLAQEGRLSLSDPISRWVKGVPNGDAISLAHLLNHTSGLFSANEDVQVNRANRPLSLQAELKVLRQHGAMACPGERWRYSNSGYVLLGAVIESIDKRPLAESIQARIIAPLGLTQTTALSPGAAIRDVEPPAGQAEADTAIASAGAAAPLAASALDMVRLEQALLGGPLLSAATRATLLQDAFPMFDPGTFYGLGVMAYEVSKATPPIDWIGHSGGSPGVKAVIAYSPLRQAIVAVALTGDGSAEAAANLLFKALRRD